MAQKNDDEYFAAVALIPKLLFSARRARREFEVAFEHISKLVADAPDPDFSRKALGQLLCATEMMARLAGEDLAIATQIEKDHHRYKGIEPGHKSGETRRSWHAYAKTRARQIWAVNKNLSCPRIAQLILEKWPADDPKRPSKRALEEFVRTLNLT
jgi:hypothetical protein